MAQPVPGYLGYDPVADRPLVKLIAGTKKLLTEDDSAGSGGGGGPHKTTHQDGGTDEINVTGLNGVLADAQVANKIVESSGPTTLTLGSVADGQLLKRSGSSIVGSSPGNFWSVDAAPESPHSQDQEFDGNSMPSGWAEWDVGGLITPSFGDGFAKFTNLSSGSVQSRGIFRTCPADAEWSIWARVSYSIVQAAPTTIGVFISEDIATNPTTSKIAFCGFDTGSSGTSSQASRATGPGYVGTLTNVASFGTANSHCGYARIGYDGTNFTFFASLDGLTWLSLGVAIAKTFTPTHAGIHLRNASGNTSYHHVDFYRVKAGAGSAGVGAGLFGGRRL